jgi:nitrate reductase assembly molybdenum cofactor insertion protein NarJ
MNHDPHQRVDGESAKVTIVPKFDEMKALALCLTGNVTSDMRWRGNRLKHLARRIRIPA